MPPLPVTLLSGFLGSGKTSLLLHVLRHRHGLRVAVILNEISEVNIDVISLEGTRLMQTDERIVEMSNGCVCCTLREDLLHQLRELHKTAQFDAVLIESSGIAEPMQTAETFFLPVEDGEPELFDVAPLDNCVTVIDASTVQEHLHSVSASAPGAAGQAACTKPSPTTNDPDGSADDEANEQSVSSLLCDQVEFANVLVLNKVDLLVRNKAEPQSPAAQALRRFDETFPLPTHSTPAARGALEELLVVLCADPCVKDAMSLLRSLNPTAAIIPACHGVVALDKILKTGNFTPAFASSKNGWMDDVRGGGPKHTPETLEYGVSSLYYHVARPFHPRRFFEWLDTYFVTRQFVPDVDDEEQEQLESNTDSSSSSADEAERSGSSDDNVVSSSSEDEETVDGDEVSERHRLRAERYGNLFRGKGFFWLGNPKRLNSVVQLSLAGNLLNVSYGGTWTEFSAVRGQPGTSRGTSSPGSALVYCPNPAASQMLVFVGQNLAAAALRSDLDSLLLTDEEWTLLRDHMTRSLRLEATRLRLGRPKKWKDRAWLNDLFDDDFEEFPLPPSPAFDQDLVVLPTTAVTEGGSRAVGTGDKETVELGGSAKPDANADGADNRGAVKRKRDRESTW